MSSDLEQRLSRIEERNARVEAEKAWEVSWCRRFFVALTTYLVAVVAFTAISDDPPFLNACIPTGGYLLSTLSFPILKGWWLGKR